jgi:predicted phosphoserine aminotransferase
MSHRKLFIPGPTEVMPEILEVLSTPQIGHRSKDCVELLQRLCHGLSPLFGTSRPALLESCPATALMEAGIRNLVPKRSLHLRCGAFSDRWSKVAASTGREAIDCTVEWGEANLPEAVAQALSEHKVDAVCVTHNETSTGVMNPLAEIAAVIREHDDVFLLVDCVTSLAGAPLDFDELGIDLAFASTQKCLALPGGFTVYAVSERALERSQQAEAKGWLLDFVRATEGLAEGKSVATPSIPHLYALELQLSRIAAEGLENRFARHTAMAERTRQWAKDRGLSMFSPDGYHSPTVSTIRSGDIDVAALNKALAERGFEISNGYGKLKGITMRIGHMGDHTLEGVEELLGTIDECLG